MQQVTLDEAKTRLADLIDAALEGETVSIAKDEQHAVQLVPLSGRPFPSLLSQTTAVHHAPRLPLGFASNSAKKQPQLE